MNDRNIAGYEEKEHTADWELRIWGQNLSQLLTQAAVGMNSLMGIQLNEEPRIERSLKLFFADAEELLVTFLNELLFLIEMESQGFDQFELAINDRQLSARMFGAPIASLKKEIKAVTYHNLKVENTSLGLEACIVFDV